MKMNNSLGDYLLDRTESLNDELILKYFINHNDEKINRLLDSEQYLLEGSRGVGKTMLMKTAMLKSSLEFGKNNILPVWISFEESIRIERISVVDNSIDPFLQWTMGKILAETLIKLKELKPACISELNLKLDKIFGTTSENNLEKYSTLLEDYLGILERADIKDNTELQQKLPYHEIRNILDNPQSFKKFLQELIKDFKLQRIVFLFDEAAHVFSHSQQEKFFTFFKTLRDPSIACKAAVYPGITNYGKYFERGQDAKELRLDWNWSNENDIRYIKDVLKKRIQDYSNDYWHKLTLNEEIINTICICSNGNPRFAFHIIDEIENSKGFETKLSNQFLINIIRTVFNTKWKEFETLKKRLLKYSNHIAEGEELLKNCIIPNLRTWNNKRRDSKRKLSIGVYIATEAYSKLEKLFATLEYSNMINVDHSKKSIGHNKYGFYVTINPSLIFTDLVLKDTSELKTTSIAIENNQAYYITSESIKDVASKLSEADDFKCSNDLCDFETTDEVYIFCPKCGNKIQKNEHQSLYKILRAHGIENLSISKKIVTRLEEKFSNIGELYDANIEDIKMKYIKNIRASKVKSSVIEYMAG
ncbi:hypothetical protein G3444_04500 [Shewanella baltica]|nr:hypothetical protein [Shewanella baltica]